MIARLWTAAVLFVVSARAQDRAAAVDATAVAGPNASIGGGLTSGLGSAPSAITLNLTAPGLSALATLTTVAPTPVRAPALAAAPLAAPLASPLALPVPLAPAPIVAAHPAAPDGASPMLPAEKLLVGAGAGAEGTSRMDESALISFTRKLFGEDAGEDAPLSPYLRPDQPLAFGAAETALYKEARTPAERVAAAASLLRSAGVEFTEPGERLRITPVKGGTRLNALAYDMERAHGAALEYDPGRLGDSGVASFNHRLNTLFLPHFGHSKSYAAVLHESHHSQFAARQSRGDLSPFHAAVLARHGAVVPQAFYYADYMSFEELTAHAKTIKHLLTAARRERSAGFARRYEIDAEVIKAGDVARTALIVARRLLVELDAGTPVVPVPDDHWALPELGPIPGGRWHMMGLPWNTFFIPVLDGPAPAPRSPLARLFKKAPPTAAQAAVRATAQTVLAYLRETTPALDRLHEGLGTEEADLDALNALADTLSVAGPRAEKAFKSATLAPWTPEKR